MRIACLVFLCLVAACARAPHPGRAERAHVYLVVVDGLAARYATPAHMPALSAVIAGEPGRSTFFHAARAVMPTRTNPNHVTLVTGVYAEAHGIVGNAVWDRTPGAAPERLESADRIEVETLFTVAETTDPRRVTLGVFAKPKLARLFAAAPGQRPPDVLWSPEKLPAERRDPATGYATDAETITAALDAMAAAEPDLAFLNLADVDRAGHAHGPESAEYAVAIAGADAAIGRLVEDLRARGRWQRAVLIVTADHGMSAVAPTPERPRPAISLGVALRAAGIRGMTTVADGGVDHLYLDGLDPGARLVDGGGAAVLERAASVVARTPGVAEVLARLPIVCPRCRGVPLIHVRHPDWHVDHERTGELLAVAAPGVEFVDPAGVPDTTLRGNHGGPGDRDVPLVVSGGWIGLRTAPAGARSPELVDVAPTIELVLGLRPPRRVDGSIVPGGETGHAIKRILDQRPH